jgi:hypothetical protein
MTIICLGGELISWTQIVGAEEAILAWLERAWLLESWQVVSIFDQVAEQRSLSYGFLIRLILVAMLLLKRGGNGVGDLGCAGYFSFQILLRGSLWSLEWDWLLFAWAHKTRTLLQNSLLVVIGEWLAQSDCLLLILRWHWSLVLQLQRHRLVFLGVNGGSSSLIIF